MTTNWPTLAATVNGIWPTDTEALASWELDVLCLVLLLVDEVLLVALVVPDAACCVLLAVIVKVMITADDGATLTVVLPFDTASGCV